MEQSISEIARLTGTTSRTLRHYQAIGLLEPSRVGYNGYRYYDDDALVRLQRILLLRQLGLGLEAIASVLSGAQSNTDALDTHLRWLHAEREHLDRQIRSVETTLKKLTNGEHLMAEEMFDGFDHTAHREEVVQRWGADTYQRSNTWWTQLSEEQRKEFLHAQRLIQDEFGAAQLAGHSPESDQVQAIAAKQVDWLRVGAEGTGMSVTAEYVAGLGELYVSDPRFGKNYTRHDPSGAEYVRDALAYYASHSLTT
ncbi:MerR family transcriptional regulator [Lysinibacter cavernae]|uniref:DNA-binding transcriptional MerR regulator n=1 Tax=Lysinibacter cavernae TaxID=1640652 RepID=A0A7X5R4S5_9MICO|nr:TipAS antibiotic-recognition domain-containing protein [Lysinibacter cavernae]NIH55310.1 DNA-binding transcriptional MerR regulator [Lysinibacter cavernae]